MAAYPSAAGITQVFALRIGCRSCTGLNPLAARQPHAVRGLIALRFNPTQAERSRALCRLWNAIWTQPWRSSPAMTADRWMSDNAFVAWTTADEPWLVEHRLLQSRLVLPVNIRDNPSQRHTRAVSQIPRKAVESAALKLEA